MEATNATVTKDNAWSGGKSPFGASYGKIMMWFFLVSDTLTFSGFLAGYGLTRFKFINTWPIADEVFTHIPFIHGEFPMIYVAFMTFVLIFSSVTMVLAVDAGHHMKKNKVIFYLGLTVIGGLIFVGSQAWEWTHFIKGENGGAIQLYNGEIVQFVDGNGQQIALKEFADKGRTERVKLTRNEGIWFMSSRSPAPFTVNQVVDGFNKHPKLALRIEKINPATKQKIIIKHKNASKYLKEAKRVVIGANLRVNEYGKPLFADFFFFITGFHGFHVITGVVLNLIILFNVISGTYERRGHYEMVEKVGLYWHFVDLVWVFIFTVFYLI